MPDWFHQLFGFPETEAAIRNQLRIEGETLRSLVNGRSFRIGTMETPSLAELRGRAASLPAGGPILVRNVVGEAGALHADPAYAHALFQAASQFNLLEMVGPEVTPEVGVTGYVLDRTQGPACAMAAAAGAVYRNWFAPVDGRIGQSAERQIDCLRDMHDFLAGSAEPLWRMRNGYALLRRDAARRFSELWAGLSDHDLDQLRGRLRIGLHWRIETTAPGAGHLVSQAYCSALPLGGYADGNNPAWQAFARLILEGVYEATLLAARINMADVPGAPLFLTKVGGGVFGNDHGWIRDALRRAFDRFADSGLDVRIVHFGRVDPAFHALERG